MAAGKDLNVGLRAAQLRVRSFLRRLDGNALEIYRSEAPKVLNDPHLSEASRARFEELWTTYQSFKDHIENPRGKFDAYKAKVEGMDGRLDQIARRFKSEEGIELRVIGFSER